MNLLQISNFSEKEAREYLESIRWPSGPVCPHCGCCEKVYRLKGNATRDGLLKCSDCRRQFTVTVGTVMHRSHLTCKQWALAMHLMCSSKKGVSALQLKRELGLASYESAWFLCHRIRLAMEEMHMLSGTVEVDETFVGGKGSSKTRYQRQTPVIALVSREEETAHSRPVENTRKNTLQQVIFQKVYQDSRIMTDELHSYKGIHRYYAGGHGTVSHGRGEYSRGDIHVNNAESYFALLKRGTYGVFHHVSRKHLGRYCAEFTFRWNRRKINDTQRTESVIGQVHGKRLTYDELVNKP